MAFLALVPFVSLIGYAVRSDSLVLLPAVLTWVIAPASLIALLGARGRAATRWVFSLATNGIALCYFTWLFFIYGRS